jgi:hypothetical protein
MCCRYCKGVHTGGSVVVGVGITTIGILLLVLGLVGAGIEVYVQVLSAIVQQKLSAVLEQLPAILRPEVGTLTGASEPPYEPMDILWSLIETVIATPLWLTLTVVGIVLIYVGLFVSQKQRLRRQP